MSAIFLITLCFGLFFMDSISFPGLSALSICSCSILLIQFTPGTKLGYVPRAKLLQYLGKISYSVYLVHWPMLVLLNYMSLDGSSALQRITTAVVSIFVGAVLHSFVENPFQRKLTNAKKLFLAFATLFIFFNCFLLITDKVNVGYMLQNKDNAVDKEILTQKFDFT